MKRKSIALSFETLEARDIPAVLYNPGGWIDITGTGGGDRYNIYEQSGPQGWELVIEEGTAPAMVKRAYPFATKPVSRINANLLAGNDTLFCAGSVSMPLFANGGTGIDTITGGNNVDEIRGGDNNDTITGGNGDDKIWGDNHNDTIYGGIGNDFIYGGANVDYIYGNDGDDVISGETGNDWIWGHQGVDTIFGGEDSDDRIWGGTEDDWLYGNGGNDFLYGEIGMDHLYGNDGNDRLEGGEQADYMDGGRNNDTLIGGNDADTLFGGDHNDRLEGDGVGSTLPGNDILDGGNNDDRIYGDDGNDILKGGSGIDRLYGGNQNDFLYGQDGGDFLYGENGNDYLNGGLGLDRMEGGNNDDTLISLDNSVTDILFGNAGFDSFWTDRTNQQRDSHDANTEEQETNLHEIRSFQNGADRTANGDNIADPTAEVDGEVFEYERFSARPLFSNVGPLFTDVVQGKVGDCWLLASLATGAHFSPNVIRQMVADLGDNTYAIQLGNEFYRVDMDLPVRELENPGDPFIPAFAKFGAEDSLWVAMIEKAYATKRNRYQRIDGDSPREPLNKMGGTGVRSYWVSDGSEFSGDMLANNLSGVLCTRNNWNRVSFLLPEHCYTILSITSDASGTMVRIYNPHGRDALPSFDEEGNILIDPETGLPFMDGVQGEDDGIIDLSLEQLCADAGDPAGVYVADFARFL